MYTGHQRSVDQRLAGGVGTLLLVGQDVRFRGERDVAIGSLVRSSAISSPFACFRTVVCGLCSVVEAELAISRVREVVLGRSDAEKHALPFATLASEGKEI